MPAWKSKYMADAVRSIVGQTCPDWELVVVDDCSPEDLGSVVKSFDDSRIRYVRNEENIGGKDLVAQWNHCIGFAKGEYIVLAADDDLYAPTFCEECLELVRKYPEVDVIHASVEEIDGEGAHVSSDTILPEYTSQKEYFKYWVTGKVTSCVGNFMLRKSALDRIGGFLQFPCGFGSDIATPLELSQKGVANTSSMLFRFRQWGNHLSADSSRYVERLDSITQLSQYLRRMNDGLKAVEDSYLQQKCVYDYLHQVVFFLPFRKLNYMKYCTLAGPADRVMMFLRWIKHRIL